ncbi:MAG: hypothetical protein HRU11_12350 [Parvularculaceae bacterium]|nr:hypothetical protein [Parvularculaceae bacterium]
MARYAIAALALALLAACSTTKTNGFVMLCGQFSPEAPPPREMRVMLDPHYGDTSRNSTEAELREVADRPFPYAAIFPTEEGSFESPLFEVDASHIPGEMTPPTFFLAFENERNVLYAVGDMHAAVQYRVYDAKTKEPLDRADACWRIVRGRYESFGYRKTKLEMVVVPNWDSPKRCLPPGDFTPSAVERMGHNRK